MRLQSGSGVSRLLRTMAKAFDIGLVCRFRPLHFNQLADGLTWRWAHLGVGPPIAADISQELVHERNSLNASPECRFSIFSK